MADQPEMNRNMESIQSKESDMPTNWSGWQHSVLRLGALLTIASLGIAAEPDRRLVNAAAGQDYRTLQSLLKQHVDVNATREDGSTALVWAAHWDNLEIADALLHAGAKVNAADDYGVTPLHQAAENADPAMVEKLLNAGANASAAETSGLTPLMIAAHTDNLQVVKLLLAHGADVNASAAETKTTALMWAVSEGKKKIVEALIAAHADVHASMSKGFTALLYTAGNGDIEMAKILIAAGVNVNEPGSDGTHALPLSIVKGRGEYALFLLDQGADPNADMDGIRPLHAAAGSTEMWLADWGRKHEHVSEAGGLFTGGFLNGNRDVRLRLVKSLIAHGADVNARVAKSAMFMGYIGYPTKGAFEPFACGTGDVRGATPLWVAAYTANGGVGGFGGDAGVLLPGDAARTEATSDIIRTLLAAGADLRLTSNDGTTPLMVAAGLGRATFSPGIQRGRRAIAAEEAVKILVEAGSDVNTMNEGDYTALHGAAFRGLNEVIEYLVAHGADINARDYRGRTAFRLAEGSKQSFQFQAYPETAEVIRKLGADTRLGVPGTVQERLRDVPPQEAVLAAQAK
jgi:ankyrin repeat protein